MTRVVEVPEGSVIPPRNVISGHQPVYLPWLGLLHKLYLCDTFVFMDTVQYLDGDWNNRNRIRTSHGWTWLTVPVDRRASTGKNLDQIVLKSPARPDAKDSWQRAHWLSLKSGYGGTPHFHLYSRALEEMYLGRIWHRLNDLCWEQFNLIRGWFGLSGRRIVRMSEMEFEGRKSELLLDHCRRLDGDAIVLGAQGKNYLDRQLFRDAGIRVYFQEYRHPVYEQRFPGFESNMTSLDLLFNHGPGRSVEIMLQDNLRYDQLRSGSGPEDGSEGWTS